MSERREARHLPRKSLAGASPRDGTLVATRTCGGREMTTYGRMIWIALAAAAATAGCTLDSPTYITSQDSPITEDAGAGATGASASGSSASASTAAGGAATCSTTDFVKPDLATLTACGDGKGHCFAKDKVSLASMLTDCPRGLPGCMQGRSRYAAPVVLSPSRRVHQPGGRARRSARQHGPRHLSGMPPRSASPTRSSRPAVSR